MKSSAATSPLGSQFDAFLFAPIGEDRNGLPLSVVSLLARMDLDPWREAAGLARLPTQAAGHKLAGLLAALPTASLDPSDPETAAARLIALLPRPTDHATRAIGMVRIDAGAHPRVLMHTIMFAVWLVWLLGIRAYVAGHYPVGPVVTHTPAAAMAPSQTAPTTLGAPPQAPIIAR